MIEDGCYREQTRTWTAKNKCGETRKISRTVRWKLDTAGPALIAAYQDKAIPCGQDPAEYFDEPEFEEGCDGDMKVEYGDDVRDPLEDCTFLDNGTYTLTRTWTATDDCQKTSSVSQTITVGPCIPSIDCPGDLTADDCEFVPDDSDFTDLTANDVSGFVDEFELLDITPSEITGEPKPEFGVIVYSRTLTVTDSCGNQAECTQNITVPLCDTVEAVGCSRSFWREAGLPYWDDALANITKANLRFTTTTDFREYFGLPAEYDPVGFFTLPAGITMLEVLSLQDIDTWCWSLVYDAVTALLNAAAFPDNYDFPDGLGTFELLYGAILQTFLVNDDETCRSLSVVLINANRVTESTTCLEVLESEFACTSDFWLRRQDLWDSMNDQVVATMPIGSSNVTGTQFVPSTNFWHYFSKLKVSPPNDLLFPFGGLSPKLSMAEALDPSIMGGDQTSPCVQLVTESVLALLNAAASPTTYNFAVTGTTNFTSLYNLLFATFRSGNCSTLLANLKIANAEILSTCPVVEGGVPTEIRIQCFADKEIPCGGDPLLNFDTPTRSTGPGCELASSPIFRDMRVPATGVNPDGTYSVTRTFTILDSCGGIVNCSQTVKVLACATKPALRKTFQKKDVKPAIEKTKRRSFIPRNAT